MAKSDYSIHNICIASIKRSTIKSYDFKWTKYYESNESFYSCYPSILIDLLNEELIICSTVINTENFSVLTSRKLITNEGGTLKSASLEGALDKAYGDFKGYKIDSFTFGQIQLKDGDYLKYFIEVGNASMIMIYGIRTLIQLHQ